MGDYAREVFENRQKQDPETLTDIQRAQRFFCLHKMSFNSETKNFGQDVLNRYDAKNTPFYLDLALPRARKRLRQGFLLSEDFESLATVKGQGKFLDEHH